MRQLDQVSDLALKDVRHSGMVDDIDRCSSPNELLSSVASRNM
jgi:hypothetical protein